MAGIERRAVVWVFTGPRDSIRPRATPSLEVSRILSTATCSHPDFLGLETTSAQSLRVSGVCSPGNTPGFVQSTGVAEAVPWPSSHRWKALGRK